MEAINDNPLLGITDNIPFQAILPGHVGPGLRTLIERAQAAVEAISAQADPRTYENTLGALEEATQALEVASTVVGHLESVASTPELRAAYNALKPEVSAFYAGIPLHAGLYQALKNFAATAEAKNLTGAKKRFLQKTMDDFVRHGAELDPAGKQRLEAISRELAEITAKYSQNVVDATAHFELIVTDEARLTGLPDSAREAAAENARQKGKEGWRFTLQATSVIPVLTYLDDGAIREQIWRAYNRRGADEPFANPPLASQILALRREQATLLGYATFADLVLADRMAKKGETARAFVDDLIERTRPAFLRENQELVDFRRASGDLGPMMPWDVGYWAEKLRQDRYDFDEEALRPYFPAEKALRGVFETAERLYGIKVVRSDDRPGWHASVESYDVLDGGQRLGSFYVDLFPREEKRGGAWMNGLISGILVDDQVTPHLGLICANVTPPVGAQPALLTHDEVSTLYHEFGHLLHHLLSRVEVRSLAGTNVAWDFVELPSQIMENWCWEKQALDLFARHWQTGAPIPDDLFEKMTKARTFREANAMMRQLGFASVDLALHTHYDPSQNGELIRFARDHMQAFAPAPLPDDYGFIASFGHLFASAVGYAAGYYSYKWAEVLDADAFSRFQADGVFSRKVGDAFRRQILEQGDAADPLALYQQFMGRPPALEPLLRRAGLLEEGR